MRPIILSILSKAMTRYLQLDPESQHRLDKLKGYTIAIQLLPFHITCQCVFTHHDVQILADDTLPADVTIRGTPLQLVGVMFTKENRHRFFADDVVIEGNAEIGQQVIALFDHLHIDWEEQLSHVVGDIPAYRLNQAFKHVGNWFSQSEQAVSDALNDYLHEETTCFPPAEALQDFFADIDTLRMDVDRAEARLQQLRARIEDTP